MQNKTTRFARIRPLAGIVFVMLTACSLGTPVDTGRGNMWRLEPLQAEPQRARYGALVVEAPSTAAELDTYRVALRESSGAADYYAGTRWVDFLPVTVQAALVESLKSSGLFADVADDVTDSRARLALQVELQRFHASYSGKTAAPKVELAIDAALINRSNGAVLKRANLRSARLAQADDSVAVSRAFREAFADAQRQLVRTLVD